MGARPFVHLHTHSHYSLLDGCCAVDRLVESAATQGMPALALTDHGAMFGALAFYRAARERGVKPLIGCEVYVAPGARHDRSGRQAATAHHLTLLARDARGYRNLLRLATRAYTEGFYYRPRVDRELLWELADGLIALSGCLAGEIPRLVAQGQSERAREAAAAFADRFGAGGFYLELQDHGIAGQAEINRGLLELARDLSLPVVATNDVHYLTPQDARVHDCLLCIQTGKTVSDPDRLRFERAEYYLKSAEEMERLFSGVPAALDNTLRIADACDVQLELGRPQLPAYPGAQGQEPDVLLRDLVRQGAGQRFGDPPPAPVTERLAHELAVIGQMGYAGYFLIVWDFVRYARQQDIAVGPGRGSAASSLVAYCLGITDVDPLRYGLVFERFLSPQRVTLPDIDIDFCYERRGEVIDYVVRTYGSQRVAQIATFGTLAARAAIRDVGRVLERPYAEVDALAKQVPAEVGVTLEVALAESPELRAAWQRDPQVREWLELAKAVEGAPRHLSVHAAGVVIGGDPLTEHVPLAVTADGTVVTQYPMEDVEALGLLKMDFLGLRTLTVVSRAREILARQGEAMDVSGIDLEDTAVYAMLARGDSEGVFQLESRMFQQLLRQVQPSCFADLVAVLALGRPGPMGRLDDFIRRKHGQAPLAYAHPVLEPVLAETYGVIVYQEQVMRIAMDLAGYTPAEADLLRRGMGKKKPEIIAAERERFLQGAADRGVEVGVARQIFEDIERFAQYGFPKSHSTAYALVAYWTAYLKCHHPEVFMAAQLSSVAGSSERVARYVEDCRQRGIAVLPPEVNASEVDFSVEGGAIRFGLSAVRNVGRHAAGAIVGARRDAPFRSLLDFCRRVDPGVLQAKALESLIQAGALDSLGERAHLLAVAEQALQAGARWQEQQARGQASLFETGDESELGLAGQEVRPLSPADRLAMEKEVLGLYLSGHPLAAWEGWLRGYTSASLRDLTGVPDGVTVSVAGCVESVRRITSRSKEAMGFVRLEDRGTAVDVVILPPQWARAGKSLEGGAVLVVRGRLERRSDEIHLVADEVIPVAPGAAPVQLNLAADPDKARRVVGVLARHPGETPVLVRLHGRRARVTLVADASLWAAPGRELLTELRRLQAEGALTAVVTAP